MQDWKDDIINSVRNVENVAPPGDTFFSIQKKVKEDRLISKREWIAVAATVSLIAISNLLFITTYTQQETEPVDQNYSGLVSNYNLYEDLK